MRSVARVSILLSALLVGGNSATAENIPATKADERAYDWCLSRFPNDDNPWSADEAKPLPLRVEKFRPFDLTGARTPPGLVSRTEIIGSLPPEIAKYQGQWIWPTYEGTPHIALFVERLTASEMTLGWAIKPEEDKNTGGYRDLRKSLKWTGKSFTHTHSAAEGSETLDIFISAGGDAMLIWSGYSRLVTLRDKSGKESSHTFREGWPLCLISSKRP